MFKKKYGFFGEEGVIKFEATMRDGRKAFPKGLYLAYSDPYKDVLPNYLFPHVSLTDYGRHPYYKRDWLETRKMNTIKTVYESAERSSEHFQLQTAYGVNSDLENDSKGHRFEAAWTSMTESMVKGIAIIRPLPDWK